MKNLKELERKFEELKKEGKIVVEVKQNKKIVNYWLDEKSNIMQLLGFLYNKTVIKCSIKLNYSYNIAIYRLWLLAKAMKIMMDLKQ